jgi:hypothetical protein
MKPKNRAGKRYILLHYHIFKNAGTTVSFVLRRNFGRRVAFLDSEDFNAIVDNGTLIDFLQKRPSIRAVSSHQLRPPKPHHEHFCFRDILFLRDPLARLSSSYDFYRRTKVTEDPLTTEAKRRTVADFMELLIESYPYYVNNVQVNFLAALNRRHEETELQAAVRIASDATVLGVTELFDLGAVTAEYVLSSDFHRLNFGYIAQNVSSVKPRDLDIHLTQFREACGRRIYEQLVERSALDLELLKLARKEVYRRFESIPGHEDRLQNFHVWRSALHSSSMRAVLASNHPHEFIHYANVGID